MTQIFSGCRLCLHTPCADDIVSQRAICPGGSKEEEEGGGGGGEDEEEREEDEKEVEEEEGGGRRCSSCNQGSNLPTVGIK